MSRGIVSRFVQDSDGNALNGATVTVRRSDDSLATIYATRTDGSPISGSVVTADADGKVVFYADQQILKLVATGDGGDVTVEIDHVSPPPLQLLDAAEMTALLKASLPNRQQASLSNANRGLYEWVSGSTATADGDTVFAADEGGTGRWLLRDRYTTATISSFGATLVDDTDAATARTTLGLGDAITYTGNVDDPTIPNGEYFVDASATGTKPSGVSSNYGHLSVSRATAFGRVEQIWTRESAAPNGFVSFRRYYVSGVWSAWRADFYQGGTDLPVLDGGTGASDAAGARTNLGLGTAATADVTTSATDTTPGRLLKVGDGGLLGQSDNPSIDLDSAHYGAFANSGSGSPPISQPDGETGAARWAGITFGNDSAAFQLARKTAGVGGGLTWVRHNSTGVWTAWRRLFDQGSILGTVSQSGGVPTGAVIERGSNASGQYTRYADGTQECWTVLTMGSSAPTTWTFPVIFASSVTPTAVSLGTIARMVTVEAIATTSTDFNHWSSVGTRIGGFLYVRATGRWF